MVPADPQGFSWAPLAPEPGRWLRLRWWVEDRLWDARSWLGDKLLAAADRLHGLAPFNADADAWAGFPVVEEAAPFDATAFLLGAAAPVTVEPPPLVTLPPVPTFEQWCELVAETRLATEIADHFELEFGQVWTCLGRLPANQRPLLDSPQGWSIIADYAASAVTGITPAGAVLLPRVH